MSMCAAQIPLFLTHAGNTSTSEPNPPLQVSSS
jgi:hypothetical protein